MSGKKLLLYLAVLLVVAGGYFFLEVRHSRQAAQEMAAKQIFQLKTGDITALTLKSDKGEIRLERVAAPEHPSTPANPEKPPAPATPAPSPPAEEWRITKPIAVEADKLTMQSLLTALTDLKMQRQLDEMPAAKLKEFGLEKPVFTLEFQAGGQARQLRFGNKAPGGQSIYAQRDTEPRVFLVRTADKETLDRNLTALRTKNIFMLAPERVTEIRLIRNQDRLTLHKTKPSEWEPGEKLQTKLRTDRINTLLGQISGVKAMEFVAEKADDLKKYGLAPAPTLRLTLMSGKKEETLILGSKQGERFYAQISGTAPVMLVDKSWLEKLPTSYEALEDRRLWAGQDTEVQKVIWGAPDKQITAVRDQKGWNIQGAETPSRQESPMKFGLAFWRLRDVEFIRLAPAAGGKKETKPLFTLQLFGSEDTLLFQLEEMSPEKDQVQVRFSRGEKTLAAVVPAKALSQLKETLEGLATPALKSQGKAPPAR